MSDDIPNYFIIFKIPSSITTGKSTSTNHFYNERSLKC